MPADESKIKWEQFISGDNNSYSWLYTTYVQMLFQYGLRFTSDTGIIQDCIQDIFTYIYKNRQKQVVPDNVKVYLFVAFKNNLIRNLYKELTYKQELTEDIPFLLETTVEDKYIENEQEHNNRKKVEKILSILSPRQKEIIYYRFIQGLNMDEICLLMNLNYQSAQNLIQRSLKKVRTHFNDINTFIFLLINLCHL